MPVNLAAALRRATAATRNQNLMEATRIIQEALSSSSESPKNASKGLRPAEHSSPHPSEKPSATLPPRAEEVGKQRDHSPRESDRDSQSWSRPRRPLAQVLKALSQGDLKRPLIDTPMVRAKLSPSPSLPDGARYATRGFRCAAGSREYKLFVSSSASAGQHPNGLIVMLHGCKQNPDDFATGTNMNAVAEAHNLIVVYPSQTNAANPSGCWNWFSPAHQYRDGGEPAIIAGITNAVAAEFGIRSDRIFVAGLSAGGAMAVVMGATYPDLYSGVGVHSGLNYKAANDVVSAFAVMRGEPGRKGNAGVTTVPRTIVFHGTEDRTVDPSNADQIVETARSVLASDLTKQDSRGLAAGRAYARTTWANSNGGSVLEYWLIDGGGHAWAGGHPSGSFVDTKGPNASVEMVRFFMAYDK